jgi:adenylate kinase
VKIILLAVPGAGKSTIIQFVQKLRPYVKTIVYGDIMLEISQSHKHIHNRDDLRTLPISQQKQIQKEAAHHIASIEGDVIIDTHASVKTPVGYWSGLPANIIREIGPDLIVLLEFNPDAVMNRRTKDMTIQQPIKTKSGIIITPRPSRDHENPEEIELHQDINRHYAIASSHQIGCPLKIIDLRFPEEKAEEKAFHHTEVASQEIILIMDELRE